MQRLNWLQTGRDAWQMVANGKTCRLQASYPMWLAGSVVISEARVSGCDMAAGTLYETESTRAWRGWAPARLREGDDGGFIKQMTMRTLAICARLML